VNRVRKTVPIIFGILILTSLSGFQFAPMTVQTAEAAPAKKIIGYFPEWESADVSAINYTKLTHIIYFHIWPNADGSLDTSAVVEEDLINIRNNATDAEVKVMIAAGGWGVSKGFAPMAADDTARENFVNNIELFLENYGLDGVDIDWEPIDSETKKINQAALLHDLRAALPDKLVTVAVNAERIDLFPSSKYDIDWVNVMAYDMNWRHGNHSNFDDAVAALEMYEEVGIPEEKLALGIPFYGRNAQTKALTYEQLVDNCNPSPSVNYCNGYFFNGIDLVKQKSQFVLNSNYAGVMIWNLGQDTYDNKTSLLNAIYETLDVPPPPPGPPLANPDSYSVDIPNTLNVDFPGVLLNDIEPDGDSMTAYLNSTTLNGNLTLNSDGSFGYIPNSDFLGIDSFSYYASDGNFTSNSVNVTIQVNTTPSKIEETSSGFQDRNTVTSVTTSDSISGVSNNLYITSISVNPKINVQSVTGMDLDWIPLDSQCGSMGGSQTEVWFAIGDETTFDGLITAQLESGAKSMIVSASRISGINPQEPFGTIITGNNNKDSSCTGGSPSSSYDLEVDIQNQNSMLFGAIGASYEQNGYQHTPGAGFLEIFHWVTKFSDVGLSVVQKPDLPMSTTSLDGTFSQLRDWHVIGIEIKPEGLGGTTNSPPTSNVGGPYTENVGIPIIFDGTGSFDLGGSIISYDWDFGDGNVGSEENPSHSYDVTGTYNVSLTVTDNDGAEDSSATTATITSQGDTNLTVTGIAPNNMTKGDIITTSIYGTGFQTGAVVTFGGSGFAPTVLNTEIAEEEITIDVTRDTRGPKRDYVYDVTVTNPDGGSVTLPQAFTVKN
jgi:GH18 family chitinase